MATVGAYAGRESFYNGVPGRQTLGPAPLPSGTEAVVAPNRPDADESIMIAPLGRVGNKWIGRAE